MVGLAYDEICFVLTPTFSSILISCCTHIACFKGEVYGFFEIGRLSLLSTYMVINVVSPMSEELDENTC